MKTLAVAALVILSVVVPVSAVAAPTLPITTSTQSTDVFAPASAERDSFTVTTASAAQSQRPPHTINTRRPYEGNLKVESTRAFLNGYVVTITN